MNAKEWTVGNANARRNGSPSLFRIVIRIKNFAFALTAARRDAIIFTQPAGGRGRAIKS